MKYKIGDKVVIGRKNSPQGELVAMAEIIGVQSSLKHNMSRTMFTVKDILGRVSEISEESITKLKG